MPRDLSRAAVEEPHLARRVEADHQHLRALDDIAVALFLASPESTTLPVRIYVYIDQTYDPLITAVSAVVVFLAFGVLAVMERTMGVGKLFGLR